MRGYINLGCRRVSVATPHFLLSCSPLSAPVPRCWRLLRGHPWKARSDIPQRKDTFNAYLGGLLPMGGIHVSEGPGRGEMTSWQHVCAWPGAYMQHMSMRCVRPTLIRELRWYHCAVRTTSGFGALYARDQPHTWSIHGLGHWSPTCLLHGQSLRANRACLWCLARFSVPSWRARDVPRRTSPFCALILFDSASDDKLVLRVLS